MNPLREAAASLAVCACLEANNLYTLDLRTVKKAPCTADG
jgi:hypothetical protein